MIPVIIQLGPLPINSFGLLLVLALLAGWARLVLDLKWAGEDSEQAERIVFWAGVGGVLGARLAFIASFPQQLLSDPVGAVFGGAGFVYYGGLLGGTLAVMYLIKRNGASVWKYSDLVTPTLAIGYAVGRIGCQLSGDGDYGIASELPWAVSFAHGVVPTAPGVRVHPTPVYETLAALLIAFILAHLIRSRRFSVAGQVMGVYLILTSLERFLVEFVR
ncbi:MAG: prolipoprotein diacylglyceryl transferase, partial [Bdellovibrionales bacterium]|nr:prolipoprotein diacylglyceryl transferase [Bdellovibrionales bacterium]